MICGSFFCYRLIDGFKLLCSLVQLINGLGVGFYAYYIVWSTESD